LLIFDLKLGFEKSRVRELIQKHGFANVRIMDQPSEIRIYTPLEFGAGNWVIIFGFSEDKLITIRVRKEDNIYSQHPPRGAPDDIGYWSFRKY
jgi:hypothetical protein